MIAGYVRFAGAQPMSIRLVRKSIEKFPGASFTEIKGLTGLSTGSTDYAIRRLRRFGLILEESFWRNRRYFEPSVQEQDRRIICVLRNRSARKVLETMLKKDSVTAKKVREVLGVSYPTVNWHMRRLAGYGVINKLGDGAYAITDRKKVFEVLGRYSESLTDNLANNFGSMWEI